MIPTMILVGLLLGQWPRLTLAAAAIGWPVLLLACGAVEQASDLASVCLGGALLAVANTGVGILTHHAARWLLRLVYWSLTTVRSH